MSVEFTPVEVTRELIPVTFRARIEAKLAKLTKRLAKIGAPAPTVEFGPTEEITEIVDGWEFKYTVYSWVTVTGVEARHSGWTGIAVLDWTVSPDEAFVARFPGHDGDDAPVISDELRTRGPLCDHCGTNRSRNNTIVFEHDDGRIVAVGTGCVLEYVGIDPRTITLLASTSSVFDDEERDYGARPSMTPLSFVALAAELTRLLGFTRAAEPDSTKELATAIGIIGRTEKRVEVMIREAGGLDMERGAAKAEAIAAWLADESDSSDFIRSAKLAIKGNDVTAGARHAGILAALPFSHDRHIGLVAEREAKRAAEAAARKASDFIGSVGDKVTVKGEVVFRDRFENNAHYYAAPKYRITIVTPDGNRVTTLGSGETLSAAEVGGKVEMTGKVKGHDDHERFGKSTVLERVKLEVLEDDYSPLPPFVSCDCGNRTRTPFECACGARVCDYCWEYDHRRRPVDGATDGGRCSACFDAETFTDANGHVHTRGSLSKTAEHRWSGGPFSREHKVCRECGDVVTVSDARWHVFPTDPGFGTLTAAAATGGAAA